MFGAFALAPNVGDTSLPGPLGAAVTSVAPDEASANAFTDYVACTVGVGVPLSVAYYMWPVRFLWKYAPARWNVGWVAMVVRWYGGGVRRACWRFINS